MSNKKIIIWEILSMHIAISFWSKVMGGQSYLACENWHGAQTRRGQGSGLENIKTRVAQLGITFYIPRSLAPEEGSTHLQP